MLYTCIADVKPHSRAILQTFLLFALVFINHFVERDTKLLEKKRCTVEYITFPGGHVIASSDVTEQAMRWIAEQE